MGKSIRAALTASLWHLLISFFVVTVTAWFVLAFWYPYPYRYLAGGFFLLTILFCVDIVVGPLLTFVVFDDRKPRQELFFDITIIGIIQASAMIYGLWSVYQARPVYLVHEVDRFVVVSAADIDRNDLSNALPEFQKLPFSGVRLIGVRDSVNQQEFLQSIELALAGKDLSMQPNRWQKLSAENKIQILKNAKPLHVLMSRSKSEYNLISNWLDTSNRKKEELVYLPVVARNKTWVAVLDIEKLDILNYFPIDGF